MPKDRPVPDQQRPYGHLTRSGTVLGQTERLAHPSFVNGTVLGTHSHSMVAGGLLEMSYATREIPGTSLIMRLEARSRSS